jgi:hypothetical protein
MKKCTDFENREKLIKVINPGTADLKDGNWSLPALLELLEDGNWKIDHTLGLEDPITVTYKLWDTVIVKHGEDLIDVVVDIICEVYKKRG